MRTLLVALALVLTACEGPMGPEGPPGEDGPGTRITYAGRLDAFGEALVSLPAQAGTTQNPPVVSCYISDSSAGPYIVIATDTSSGIVCGLGDSAGTLAVAIAGAPSNWYYRISVVY